MRRWKPLIGQVRQPLAPAPGHVERYDSVYVRNGVASLFMTFEALRGPQRLTHGAGLGAGGQGLVDSRRYKDAQKIVLVMDQLNTHGPWSLYEAFTPDEAKRLVDKLEIHHAPKHGSWLNMAEIELSAFERDLPERVGDHEAMANHAAAWQKRRNEAKVKADWWFTTADARIKLRKLYPTTHS